MSPNPQRRIGNIDIVRGFAAVSVMLQHSFENSGIESYDKASFGFNWLNLGQTGVVAFFLVSGFVIPLSLERWNDLGRFWFSRICRLYPLYIFAFVVSAVVHHTVPGFSSIVAHLFFIQEYTGVQNLVGISWTISMELVWYLLFSILFVVHVNHKSKIITALFVGAISGGVLVMCLGGPTLPMGRVGFIATCAFGLFAYRVSRRDDTRINGCCMICIAAAIAVGLYARFAMFPRGSNEVTTFRCVALSWSLAYFVFGISFMNLHPRLIDVPLRFVGEISYSIYMLHPFVCWMLDTTSITGWLYVFIMAAITLPLAFVTYIVIERPGMRLSHAFAVKKATLNVGENNPQI